MSSERNGEGTRLSKDLRINEMIRVPNVRVVDEEGSQLGVMPTLQALQPRRSGGTTSWRSPPCGPSRRQFLDYGQFKYEQARKEKEARRHQRSVEFKEIRLKPKIGKGDFDTKVRRAIQFLEDGDRVKVTVQFRGREVSHAYIGRDLLTRFGDLIKEHGTVDRQPMLEGRSMSMTVASNAQAEDRSRRRRAMGPSPRSAAAAGSRRADPGRPAAGG